MKNFKKIVLGLMLLLATFAFVGCPTPEQPAPTPTPEQPAGGNEGTEQKPSTDGNGEGKEEDTPVVVENKFMGNIFEVSCKMPFGCIYSALEFESETVVNQYAIDIDEDFNEYIKKETLTYTVKDDVATITFTNEDGSKDTVTTSKIENDSFSFEVKELNFSCKKSDKSILEEWTMYFLGEEDDTEYFLNILGIIADYKLVENTDYTLDKENKIINITESGLAKLVGGDEEGDQPADGEYIVMYKGEIFESFSTLEEFEAFLSILDEFDPDTESGDYYSDDAFTVVLTDEGYAKLTGNDDDGDDDEQPDTWEKRSSFDGLDGKWAKKEISGEFNLEILGNPTFIDSEEYFLIEGTSIEFGIYLEMDYSDIVAGVAEKNDITPEAAYTMLQESFNQIFENCTYEDNYIVKVNETAPMSLEDVIFEDETGTSSLFVNEKLSKIKLYMEAYKDSEGNLLDEPSIEERIYTKQ